MKLTSRSLSDQQRVSQKNAMGVPGKDGPTGGPNESPHLAWSEFPPTTKSFAIICVDPDAPADASDANKADRVIAYDCPRANFYHWVLVDIPVTLTELAEGADSNGITRGGKPPGKTGHGVRGINSYEKWFAGDPAMGGEYGGYDGPWPPFNDERVHRYVFTVYALGVPSLGLPEKFRAEDALAAMKGAIVDQATLTASYALNDRAR